MSFKSTRSSFQNFWYPIIFTTIGDPVISYKNSKDHFGQYVNLVQINTTTTLDEHQIDLQ